MITFQLAANHNQEAQTGVLDLPEEEPFIVAMALCYIYMGSRDLEVMTQIWPRFKAKCGDVLQDNTLFFETMVKLYKIGDRLMMPELVDYASQCMLDRVVTIDSTLPDLCGNLNCINNNNNGGWEPHTCPHRDTPRYRNLEDRSVQLYELVTILYEKLPDEQNLRSRAIIEALDIGRQMRALPKVDFGFQYDDSIVTILKENDLVAWNVARHYRRQLEAQHRYHRAQLRIANTDRSGWGDSGHGYPDLHSEWYLVHGLDLDTLSNEFTETLKVSEWENT